MAGYLLDDQSVARLATLLREYEAGNLANRDRNAQQITSSGYPTMHVVRVTSTTPSSGLYPGYMLTYDASTDTWTDDIAIKIKDVNGGTPIAQRYLARYAGTGPSGDAVYVLDLATTGTTTTCSVLTYDYVSAISCVDGTITPVYTTVCVPCAYFCTTTTTSSTTTTTTTTAAPTTTTTTTTAAPTTTTTTTSGPTTTTTTTTECDLGGFCGYAVWQWTGVYWVILEYHCTMGCTPEPPPYSGSPYQVVSTCCTGF